MATANTKECFIIMPISDPDGYAVGHFDRVYQDIIVPSCDSASFRAIRADQVKETNLIHLDILNKLIESPMAICDLSTRNPNVMFELGIRQSFDRPVVLIQEKGTPKIFDISPLRYLEYSANMKYHEVIDTQNQLAEALIATLKAGESSANTNSIVKLLALQRSASVPEIAENKDSLALGVLHAEMRQIKNMLEKVMFNQKGSDKDRMAYEKDIFDIEEAAFSVMKNEDIPREGRIELLNSLLLRSNFLARESLTNRELAKLSTLVESLKSTMHGLRSEVSMDVNSNKKSGGRN